MRLNEYINESVFGDIMNDWRTQNRKNIKWGFVEYDVRGSDIGMGTYRFELNNMKPQWFVDKFIKGRKGIKSHKIVNNMVFVETKK